jgi:hypothetical protein
VSSPGSWRRRPGPPAARNPGISKEPEYPLCAVFSAEDLAYLSIQAGRRAVIRALAGGSQQSRYDLLGGRLFCIFIHRHSWGECPHLPPTGSSWIAVVRWRPRPSCLPHGDRPLAVELIGGHGAGVNGSPARTPGCRGHEDRAPGWPGCRPGACGPWAILGWEADASPGSSSRPGFRQAAGRP